MVHISPIKAQSTMEGADSLPATPDAVVVVLPSAAGSDSQGGSGSHDKDASPDNINLSLILLEPALYLLSKL